MEKVYIFGHRKPDTDSVTSAVALSYLKNQLGMNSSPMMLGEMSRETRFVFDYFNVKDPKYLNDVKLQIRDVDYQKEFYIHEHTSVKAAYDYMISKGTTGVPLVDDHKKFVNLVTIKNIVGKLINSDFKKLHTDYDTLLNTIEGEELTRYDDKIDGNVLIASYRSSTFFSHVPLEQNTILIVGDRHSIIEYAIQSKIKMLVIVGNGEIKEEHIQLAKQNGVNVVRTIHDSFQTTKLIGLSNYIKYLIPEGHPITFDENDYYDDFLDKSSKLKHNNYPIVDKNNNCKGLLRITALTEKRKKKVILVDHNESDQSVVGLDEAEIIEVVDHHKIGNISTNNPINFRNMSVGSTNTIVFQMYQENQIEIPKEIAGLMLSGILSDTLVLTSPTTTELDKKVVLELSSMTGVDYHNYALEMFKAGTSLEGKTKEEIVTTDIKEFPVEELKFAVSQVFTLNFEEILKEKAEYIALIESMAQANGYHLILLVVTDIIRNGSYLFYTEKAKEIIEDAFRIEHLEQGYYLDGCVSRKKQIVPVIMEKLK